MERTAKGGGIRTAAVVALCALFFLLAMGVTLLGSGVYRRTAAASDENYQHRTAMSYLVNQVRRHDEADAIAIGTYGDSDALLLYEQEGTYVTVLYCSGGYLRELYVDAAALDGFSPDDGAAILPLEGLSAFHDGEGALTLTARETGGAAHSVLLVPRCGLREVGAL